VDLAMDRLVELEGRRGVTETLRRQRLEVEGSREVALRLRALPGGEVR
jgi:hypothetical protein